jgi:hypothetical protein
MASIIVKNTLVLSASNKKLYVMQIDNEGYIANMGKIIEEKE